MFWCYRDFFPDWRTMPRKQPTPEPEASGAGVSRGSKEAISKKKKSAAAKKQGKVKSTQEPQASKDAAAKEAAAKATATDKGTPAKKTLGLKNPGPSTSGASKPGSFQSPRRVYDRFLTYEMGIHPDTKKYSPIREVSRKVLNVCRCII